MTRDKQTTYLLLAMRKCQVCVSGTSKDFCQLIAKSFIIFDTTSLRSKFKARIREFIKQVYVREINNLSL